MATADTRPPLAIRVTKSLLGYGVIAGPIYVGVAAAQVFTRDGYDPTRHAVSQLANGDLGWIQVLNFVVTGAMTIAAAVGIRRALGPGRASAWGAWLVGAYGAGLIAGGIFRADPSDGFPPGTPEGVADPSWHGLVHFASAAAGFVCLVAASFVLAARFARDRERGWAWYSRITGAVFGGSFVALASGAGGAATILVFTVAVVLAWAWLTAISIKLYRAAGTGLGA